MESIEWEQWLPPQLTSKRRPAGVVGIYKTSGLFKIFEDSFSDLKDGPGWRNVEHKMSIESTLLKFITLYFPTAQTEKQQRLGFRLHLNRVGGAIDLTATSDAGFSVSLRHILPEFGYKDSGNTHYFKVHYDEENKMHFIELGKPDYEWKKGKGFYVCEESEV